MADNPQKQYRIYVQARGEVFKLVTHSWFANRIWVEDDAGFARHLLRREIENVFVRQ